MPVHRKVILWTVLTPILLIALLVILILTFDWNRVKPWLNERVSEAIGRPFAINGDLTVTWRTAEGETGWHTLVPWPRLSRAISPSEIRTGPSHRISRPCAN